MVGRFIDIIRRHELYDLLSNRSNVLIELTKNATFIPNVRGTSLMSILVRRIENNLFPEENISQITLDILKNYESSVVMTVETNATLSNRSI